MNSQPTRSTEAEVKGPTEWRGECGVVGPFESRKVAQTFASFRIDFSRIVVERTFARGEAWYLELAPTPTLS